MVEVAMDGRWVIVRLRGAIDMNSAPTISQIVEDVQSSGHSRLRFDLSAVEFIDSRGLNLLVAANHRATAVGGQIEVVGTTAPVRRTFEICGMAERFLGDRKESSIEDVGR